MNHSGLAICVQVFDWSTTVRKVIVIAENTMSKSKTVLEMTATGFDTSWEMTTPLMHRSCNDSMTHFCETLHCLHLPWKIVQLHNASNSSIYTTAVCTASHIQSGPKTKTTLFKHSNIKSTDWFVQFLAPIVKINKCNKNHKYWFKYF